MPIIIPEIVIEAVLRESFTELRDDLTKLDDWLGIYTDTYLKDTYGKATINRIKEYIKTNEIPILLAFHDVPSKVPCVTITTLNFDEVQEKAMLGDYGYTLDEDSPPVEILSGLSYDSYDSTSGWLVFPGTTSLSSLVQGQLLVDAHGVEYTIGSIIDEPSKRWVNIGLVDIAPTNPVRVVENLNFYRERNLVVPVNHRILLSVHTEDAFMTKNLHYILLYILLSQKTKLTKRDLLLSTWSSSDFSRDLGKLPEHIYTRSIDVFMYTFFNWVEAKDSLASSVGDKIHVPKDIYDRPDGDIFTVDTTKD